MVEFANSRVDEAHVQHKGKKEEFMGKKHIIITMNESLKCILNMNDKNDDVI